MGIKSAATCWLLLGVLDEKHVWLAGALLHRGASYLNNPHHCHDELRKKKWENMEEISVFGTGNSFNHEYKSRINYTGTHEK